MGRRGPTLLPRRSRGPSGQQAGPPGGVQPGRADHLLDHRARQERSAQDKGHTICGVLSQDQSRDRHRVPGGCQGRRGHEEQQQDCQQDHEELSAVVAFLKLVLSYTVPLRRE